MHVPVKLQEDLSGYFPLNESSGVVAYDYGSAAINGFVTGADRIKLSNGKRALSFVATNSDKLVLGDRGVSTKSIGFWTNLATTTETILEARAGAGFILANAGVLSYSDFDNAYVNVANTNVVTTGWNLLVFTSATDIIISALTIALNNTTYGDLEISDIFISEDELLLPEIKQIYKSTYRR